MKWTYNEEDLKALLCPAFVVKSIKFDEKKKEIVLDIELPDMRGKSRELQAMADKLSPGPSYQ